MTTYRFKFSKGDRVKFIGHLDVMQVFQRAIKRADLPVSYSQGFNPHQLVSFALPLSLGYTSTGEYGDFKLDEKIEVNECKERLNNHLPLDMQVSELIILKEQTKNTMSSVMRGKYISIFEENITLAEVEENLEKYLQQEEINVMKKTKKGIKETNIREDIFTVVPYSDNGKAGLQMIVSAGSFRNLKPESVAEGFCNFVGKEYNRYKMSFVREDMYMEKDGDFVPLTFGVEA